MRFFQRSTLAWMLVGWHFLLAASGAGLHRLSGGRDRCADAADHRCGCSHDAPPVGSAADPRREPEASSGAIVAVASRPAHDARTCAICQYLAQHKDLPPAVPAVLIAAPPSELALTVACSAHRWCFCPYASRAPPGASRLT